MQTERNIFLELKAALQVGGLQTSMQSPDVDLDVLDLAIAGQAKPTDAVLWLHGDDEPIAFTVAQLQEATITDDVTWTLPGENLWIV